MNHGRINPQTVTRREAASVFPAEVEKLQAQFDQLRARISSAPEPNEAADEAIMGRLVKEILRSRRRRDSIFEPELFGEPAWDILLELYAADCIDRKLSISSVCYVSGVPATTALRWIKKLEQDGWVQRVADPLDGRRHWMQLTEKSASAMRAYLSGVTVRPA